jgi:DNA-binding transcriptional LysR family regulator
VNARIQLEELRLRDLNLMATLYAVLSMEGVSKAAKALGISQPAVSKSLDRLRREFSDPLLVRDGNRMRLTPRAEELLPVVASAIDHASDVFAARGPFTPAQAKGRLRIGANEYIQLVLGGSLMRLVRHAAPQLRLEFRPVGLPHPEQLLVDGVVDLIVGIRWPHHSLRSEPLFADPFACIVSADHAARPERLTMEAFCRLDHLDITPSGTGMLARAIDECLAQASLKRHVAATCSSFMAVPEMLRGTDLIALVPSRLLGLYQGRDIRRIALDFELPSYEVSMWWHNASQADPRVRWIRDELVKLVSGSGRRRSTPA